MSYFTCRVSPIIVLLVLATYCSVNVHGQVGRQQGLLDPNTAAEKDLLALPHLNETLVKEILDCRPFANMTEVNALLAPTLSKEQLTELYAKMFLHINLNTASREEILLIPGVGTDACEFLEYRPYKTLAQFRKEIGKYVNEQELARLEQYVFVPINLNTASDEDILSIPGSGRRVLREFKEYRPYKNIEQFRREMGKYWNAKEVGRLERYVTLD